jgi:hypothetical protein
MKPKRGQMTLLGDTTYKSGPYRGEVREGQLHVSHVSDPTNVIEKINAEPHEAQHLLHAYHETIKGNVR